MACISIAALLQLAVRHHVIIKDNLLKVALLSVISIGYSIMYLVGGMDQLWILLCSLM